MKTYKEAFIFMLISLLLIGGVIWVGIGEDKRLEQELNCQYDKGWNDGKQFVLDSLNTLKK